jgi:hypothetical protein
MIEIVKFFFSGLLLAILQTFIFQEVNIVWWIKPMPYLMLFLNIPISVNKFGMLIGAFFFGMTIDALGGSMGMHTAACVSLAFIKYHIDNYFLDENSMQLQGLSVMHEDYKGWQWYYIYIFSIAFIHHLIFFTFDYFRWSAFFTVIWISFTSAISTVFFVLIFRMLIGKR